MVEIVLVSFKNCGEEICQWSLLVPSFWVLDHQHTSKGYHRATYPCEVTSIELQNLLSSIGIPVIADLLILKSIDC